MNHDDSAVNRDLRVFHAKIIHVQEWYDHRLEHNNSAPILVKDKKVFGEMWHPDVYFANAKSASFQVSLFNWNDF